MNTDDPYVIKGLSEVMNSPTIRKKLKTPNFSWKKPETDRKHTDQKASGDKNEIGTIAFWMTTLIITYAAKTDPLCMFMCLPQSLRIPDSYDAKIEKICNFWTFWPFQSIDAHDPLQ